MRKIKRISDLGGDLKTTRIAALKNNFRKRGRPAGGCGGPVKPSSKIPSRGALLCRGI